MTFATTAANRLNLQVPELSRYVVSFKDLSDELPENTGIQCGMFILEIAGKYLYIPVVSKAENVQVLESMFDADTKTFIPITKKSVRWMIDKGHLMGKAERIPSSVARDPDLYDAIVPPKTGKFVYASEGRIGGFFASMSNHLKEAAIRIIDEDYDLQEAIVKVMDLDIAKEHLLHKNPEYIAPEGPPAPAVITSAEGLTEEQVQDILSKGYTVINPPKSKKVAVESTSSAYGALTRLSNLMPGQAAMAMSKDGSWVGVAKLKMAPQATDDSIERVKAVKQEYFLTENGNYTCEDRGITNSVECSYDDVIKRLSHKKATDVSKGDEGFIFSGGVFMGPICVDMVTKANGWTNIECCDKTISIHPNIRTFIDNKGSNVIMNDTAVFYPSTMLVDPLESDINTAEMKANINLEKMLPYQSTLVHRNGVYAVDGKEIGNKPKIIEHLLNTWEIDVPSVETFVKKAEDQNRVIVKMAAVRDGGRPSPGSGTKVQQFYQHGYQPGSDDNQLTGSALQRARGMASSAKKVKDVADREVMEATIISEMLQNPDMISSINEYLPDIKRAVDRLGRSLFLMRLNTDKLSDKIDAEALNNMFTATRNAYRILGDNYVELYNLVSNEA